MTDFSANQPSAAFARRLRSDARFMAYVLDVYQQQEGLSEEELAGELGTWPEMLTRLALCRRPPADAAQFAEQVRRIADYTLMDEARLAGILRQVESLERLTQRPMTAPAATMETSLPEWGVLAAARDREDEEANDEAAPLVAKDE